MIAKALSAFAILNLVILTAVTVYLVVARYILNQAAAGPQEFALLCAVQLYMTGALIASARNEHLNVDWLEQQLVFRPARRLHRMAVAVVTLVVGIFFCYWAYKMLAWNLRRPQVTPALGLPLWIPQVSIIVCAVGCTAYAIRDFFVALFLREEISP